MMITKEIPLKTPVKVTWVDSKFQSGWHYASLQAKRADVGHVTTIGYLAHVDAEKVVVSSSLDDDAVLCPLAIPVGCIQSVEAL